MRARVVARAVKLWQTAGFWTRLAMRAKIALPNHSAEVCGLNSSESGEISPISDHPNCPCYFHAQFRRLASCSGAAR